MPNTYSITVRLRRTKTEQAFVSLPITDELMESDSEVSGESRLAVERVMQAASRLGNAPNTEWKVDGEVTVELHPIQTAGFERH